MHISFMRHWPILSLVILSLLSACSFETTTETPESSPPKSSSAYITNFTFELSKNPALENVGLTEDLVAELDFSIKIIVPQGTDIEALIPTISVSQGASISPNPNIPQNFSQGRHVEYTVRSENGNSTTSYTVEVTSIPTINSFVFELSNNQSLIDAGLTEDLVADINGAEITADVPYGTDITALIPTIETSEGSSVWDDLGGAKDFGRLRHYTVINNDGAELMRYSVTVRIIPSDDASITSFIFRLIYNNALRQAGLTEDLVADINGTEITATVPYGTDISSLLPHIVISNGATIAPRDSQRLDFNDIIDYVVTANDGNTTTTYRVNIAIAPSANAVIDSFVFELDNNNALVVAGLTDDLAVTINGVDMVVEFPFGTDITDLEPTILISTGASINPSSGTRQSFNIMDTFEYVVTATDEMTTSNYKLKVSIAEPLTEANITSFRFNADGNTALTQDVMGIISSQDIFVFVPKDTLVDHLIPTIEVSSGAGVTSSIITDYTDSATYTILAQDGVTTQNYNVIVLEGKVFAIPARSGSDINGHTGAINSIAFSPDGNKIITGSSDGTAKLWDVSTMQVIHTLSHGSQVQSVDFSPTGNEVITGGRDAIARIWDVRNGEQLHALIGHDNNIIINGVRGITSVKFSNNGTTVVTGASDRTARLWNATNGEELVIYARDTNGGSARFGHATEVYAVDINADDSVVAVVAPGGAGVFLYDMNTGELEELGFFGHTGVTSSIDFNNAGDRIVTGGIDTQSVYITNPYQTIQNSLINSIAPDDNTSAVNSVQYNPDDENQILFGTDARRARIWHVNIGNFTEITGHSSAVNSAVYNPIDATQVLTGGNDHRIILHYIE